MVSPRATIRTAAAQEGAQRPLAQPPRPWHAISRGHRRRELHLQASSHGGLGPCCPWHRRPGRYPPGMGVCAPGQRRCQHKARAQQAPSCLIGQNWLKTTERACKQRSIRRSKIRGGGHQIQPERARILRRPPGNKEEQGEVGEGEGGGKGLQMAAFSSAAVSAATARRRGSAARELAEGEALWW